MIFLTFSKSPISASLWTYTEDNSVNIPFLSTVLIPSTESDYLSNYEAKIVPLAWPISFKFTKGVVAPSDTEIVLVDYISFLAESITESGTGIYFSFFTFLIEKSMASGILSHWSLFTVPSSLLRSENCWEIVGFSFYIYFNCSYSLSCLLLCLLSSIFSSILSYTWSAVLSSSSYSASLNRFYSP